MRPNTVTTGIALVAASLIATACAGTAASRPAPAPAAEQDRAAVPAAAPSATPAAKRELSPTARRLFDQAVAAADEQKKLGIAPDWEVLEQRWRAVAEAQPIPEAFFNVGVALEHRGRLDEARQAYRRALSVDGAFAPAAVNLALLDEPKEPRAALQAWTELRQRFPDDPVPRVRLAALYEAAGQLDEAWALSREALLRDPSTLGAYKVMMRVALARGKPDLAQLLAVRARKLRDRDPEIESFVGDVLLQRNDEAGAALQWKKALSFQDDFLPARYALLSRALGRHQWESVAEQAQAILRTTPNDARVHLVLGIAHRYLGQPDKALAEYELAEKGRPELVEVHLARGVALMKSKEQCEPAIIALRRYIALAGPATASDGPAPRLLRECEQIVMASRQAEEAARELKADAEREAARKAAAQAPPRPTVADHAGRDGATHTVGATRPSDDKGSGVTTR